MKYLRSQLALAGLASVAVSCAASGSFMAANHCDSTLDCPRTQVCNATTNVCEQQNGSTEVVFVALPARGQPSATAITTVQDPMQINGSGVSIPIQMNAPRPVFGVIGVGSSDMNNHDATPIAGSIRFRRQGSTPAEAIVETSVTPQLQITSSGTPFSYSEQLAAGTYDVTFLPTDSATYPPYFISSQVIEPSTAPLLLDVTYASLATPRAIVSGQVLDATSATPIPNIAVQLVDSNNRFVSNASATMLANAAGASAGTFSLWLAPGAPDGWSLQIVSAPDAPVDPTITTGRLLYQIESDALGATQAYSNLTARVPSLVSTAGSVTGICTACVDIEATVESDSANGNHMPIAGATIDLHSSDLTGTNGAPLVLPAGHRAWFQAQATTGPDGTFRARVLPGAYTVLITPPQSTPFAVTPATLIARRSLLGQVLQVRRSIPVLGTINAMVGPDGLMGMGDVEVEAISLAPLSTTDPLYASPAAPLARGAQTTTFSNGSFAILLDEGEYLLVAHPSLTSGFATQILSSVTVGWNATADATAPMEVDVGALTLSAPFTIHGVVRDSVATPVSQAVIHAYARYRPQYAMPFSFFDIEIGHATADSMGAYSMLISSAAPP